MAGSRIQKLQKLPYGKEPHQRIQQSSVRLGNFEVAILWKGFYKSHLGKSKPSSQGWENFWAVDHLVGVQSESTWVPDEDGHLKAIPYCVIIENNRRLII